VNLYLGWKNPASNERKNSSAKGVLPQRAARRSWRAGPKTSTREGIALGSFLQEKTRRRDRLEGQGAILHSGKGKKGAPKEERTTETVKLQRGEKRRPRHSGRARRKPGFTLNDDGESTEKKKKRDLPIEVSKSGKEKNQAGGGKSVRSSKEKASSPTI